MAQRRMRTGKIATDEMIAALATEAEAGYAPEQIRSSRVGRPPIGDGFTRVVQFRVEEALFEELLARASAEGQGVSEIARAALVQYLRESAQRFAPTVSQQVPDAEITAR